jgi:hypothetical protein
MWRQLNNILDKSESIIYQDVRDAARETFENGEIRCRFLRRHVEGEDTWIDIAKNREVWTDLVYELFHNAKDY